MLVGLGGDVGRWQGRLGGVGRRCGRGAGGSAEMSALSNGKVSALAVGLGGCAGSRRGFRRSLTAALRRRLSQWADVLWAMWG